MMNVAVADTVMRIVDSIETLSVSMPPIRPIVSRYLQTSISISPAFWRLLECFMNVLYSALGCFARRKQGGWLEKNARKGSGI